jgi:hypothetical protein
MSVAWKHKDWQTFKGTWFITSSKLNDFQVMWIIASSPEKYGDFNSWSKVV